MTTTITWLAAALTVVLLLSYEVAVLLVQRKYPERLARAMHANLREEWFGVISKMPGSEILEIQTLRNAMMSATMTASTAVLGLMGAVSLSAPSLHASLGALEQRLSDISPRLALELIVMTLLFASLICSAMAVRYYNHTGFICAMPIDSEERRRWSPTAIAYLRRAGILYSWGLRHLLMVAPILVSIVHPFAGPVAAALLLVTLVWFDRYTPV